MKKLLLSAILPLLISSYGYAQNTFPAAGNVGIGTTNPTAALQIGNYATSNNNQIVIPGTYNFEQVRLGQISNGNAHLEFINHESLNTSYGVRLLASIDNGSPGLLLQYAPQVSNYADLKYQTGLYMNLLGNIGIGTTNPNAILHVNGISVFGGSNANLDISIPNMSLNFLANSAQMVLGWNRTKGGGEIDFIMNGRGSTGGFAFYNHDNNNQENQLMLVRGDGNVGIGTINPDARLAVQGTIHATEIRIDQSVPTPDYVFDKGYELATLKDVKTYIDKNHHLPEIPSAEQVAKEGINLGQMNARLLKKVEELTLYLIEKDKQLNLQNRQIGYLLKNSASQQHQINLLQTKSSRKNN